MPISELHKDEFLRILWDEELQVISIDWKESTAGMTDEDMKRELTLFAALVESKKAPRILVDVTRFRHHMSAEVQQWRIKNISNRYSAAGVKRFAFLFPREAQIPATMSRSAPEEAFLTGAFNSRESAIGWLAAQG